VQARQVLPRQICRSVRSRNRAGSGQYVWSSFADETAGGDVFVITMLLRRRPDLSAEEFHDYWREHHGPLAVSLWEELGIRRYAQLHTIPTGVGEVFLQMLSWQDAPATR
jgi:EthD domain